MLECRLDAASTRNLTSLLTAYLHLLECLWQEPTRVTVDRRLTRINSTVREFPFTGRLSAFCDGARLRGNQGAEQSLQRVQAPDTSQRRGLELSETVAEGSEQRLVREIRQDSLELDFGDALHLDAIAPLARQEDGVRAQELDGRQRLPLA